MRARLFVGACLVALVAPAAPVRAQVTLPVGAAPRSDAAAAALVHRSPWEPRPANRAANRRVPTVAELAHFRRHSNMPNRARVTGRFRGTTDEVIQWAAFKWGFEPELLRAVATVESWWRMSAVRDGGDSFGLFQIRRPYHCCHPLAARSTAFNADYYGAILRSYYDGRQRWLNTVKRGREYGQGDLWGSVGVWFAGRWHTTAADRYVERVQQRLGSRTWRGRGF